MFSRLTVAGCEEDIRADACSSFNRVLKQRSTSVAKNTTAESKQSVTCVADGADSTVTFLACMPARHPARLSSNYGEIWLNGRALQGTDSAKDF